MQNLNDTVRMPAVAESAPDSAMPWHAEVGDLLAKAALSCIEHGVDIDAFLRGAWSAYVEARPGLKEYLEEMQLRTQLDEIRKAGQMAKA